MGLSYEIWATCDECSDQTSYPDSADVNPPYGYQWVDGKLYCWECATHFGNSE